MTRGYLCVGGPKAGEQIAWPSSALEVLIFKPVQPALVDATDPPPDVETFTYLEMPIRTERGDVNFMVPQGWTLADMIEELTRGYVANAKRERSR